MSQPDRPDQLAVFLNGDGWFAYNLARNPTIDPPMWSTLPPPFTLSGYAYRVVAVGDLATELEVPVPLDCSGDGVQVNHDLHDVAGALLAGFRVGDDGFAVPLCN